MVKVEMTTDCLKRLEKYIAEKKIFKDDLAVIKLWIDEMDRLGPKHIIQSGNWADHKLDRDWIGHRASKFSYSGRIIYKIIGDSIEVCEVQRITPEHNYER